VTLCPRPSSHLLVKFHLTTINLCIAIHTSSPAVFPACALQLRLPSLITTHALALSFDVCNVHICGCSGASCLLQAVALRVCALTIGLGMDVLRRYTFMHEQPPAQLRHKVMDKQQGALKIE
jgi:hypothetical protein